MSQQNAIAYGRYSLCLDGESQSCAMQFEKINSWCHAMNHRIVERFRDDGISGAKADNRPGLQAAIDAAIRCRGIMVVYSVSRLARNAKDALDIIDRLSKGGAYIALLDMSLDTSTSSGRCLFTIMSAFAQWERDQISERTSDVMLRMQADGRRMSHLLPYGWKADPKDKSLMLKDEKEQAVIADIRRMRFDEDKSVSEILRWFQEKKIKCRKKEWNRSLLYVIFKRLEDEGAKKASSSVEQASPDAAADSAAGSGDIAA